jgi:S-adenosylmethionine:tRNA ribosyltransferase-isomerase
VLVSDFDFELPPGQIAQEPPAERGNSRMLLLSRQTGAWKDSAFPELPDLLQPGDLLVLNQSRVIPARLFGYRKKPMDEFVLNGAKETMDAGSPPIEVLLTEQIDEREWRVLAKPARKVVVGEELVFRAPDGQTALEATVTGKGDFGERLLVWKPVPDFFARLEKVGHMPLPPYIRRPDLPVDRERYQTVYATESGSVAAPTAGLHFTEETIERLRSRGIRSCFVSLHVGLGTFQPVRVDRVEAIHLHSERYTLPIDTANEIQRALHDHRRIIAVGTTTVRTLEACAQAGNLDPHTGSTDIFIAPGYKFRVVDGLLTNFHLPRSTLLMLVSAFAGKEPVLAAYRHAVQQGYRFFSYGDCMLIS